MKTMRAKCDFCKELGDVVVDMGWGAICEACEHTEIARLRLKIKALEALKGSMKQANRA
jgi:hypothetical protein